MRIALLLACALLGGCDKLFGLSVVSDDTTIDAASDGAPVDAPCLGQGILTALCVASPQPMIMLTSAIDTSSDPRCRQVRQDNGPELCVLDANDIVVSEVVTVTGTRPLVLLATNTIEIANALDVSSRRGIRVGAAAQPACTSGNGTIGQQGAGGGAGGTFGFVGGTGGAGQSGSANPPAGGTPKPVTPQTGVYGGCSGGDGGLSGASGVNMVAKAGAGGGAVYAIAGSQIHITLTGSINASGAGGDGAPAKTSGGAGGGAGGFIALDAPMIVIDGSLYARGGAGGGGGGSTQAALPGTEATGPLGAISGGAAPAGGSGGGDGCGAPAGTVGGFASSALYGGGGGGGACGRIRLYGTKSGIGLINPAPT